MSLVIYLIHCLTLVSTQGFLSVKFNWFCFKLLFILDFFLNIRNFLQQPLAIVRKEEDCWEYWLFLCFISYIFIHLSSCKLIWVWVISTLTYCGCVLYTVPSTPTVILNALKCRFCLIRIKMAASPAATRLEDLKDTMVLTCWTATQSSCDGFKPSSTRISLVFFRPFLYLRQMNIYGIHAVFGQMPGDQER